MKHTKNETHTPPYMDMIADAMADERREEMVDFPTDDTIALAGHLVAADDRSVPVTIRAIAMYYKLVDEDDTVLVYRWPDGIVSVVRGDLPDPSDWEAYKSAVAGAYWSAYDRLLEHTLGPLDE